MLFKNNRTNKIFKDVYMKSIVFFFDKLLVQKKLLISVLKYGFSEITVDLKINILKRRRFLYYFQQNSLFLMKN